MTIESILRGHMPKKRKEPLWLGPCDSSDRGGITFSMLNRFMNCRERFRLYSIEGLQTTPRFDHKLEYGNMWHVCEEAVGDHQKNKDRKEYQYTGWTEQQRAMQDLQGYAKKLCQKYPFQRDDVGHWYEVCKRQFPLYLEHYKSRDGFTDKLGVKTSLMPETVFRVGYTLPSGRLVYLRGKWDWVFLAGGNIWLKEHKTKGDPDSMQIEQQLSMDLQTMMYLVALQGEQGQGMRQVTHSVGVNLCIAPIAGVLYNVVRRPLSGGKGTIRQHQPSKSNPAGESKEAFYERMAQYIKEDPMHYFMQWEVRVSPEEIQSFKRTCLNGLLSQLTEWYDWITAAMHAGSDPFTNPIHWKHPYGCKNYLDEGYTSEYDTFLKTGNEVGLTRSDKLFEELTL